MVLVGARGTSLFHRRLALSSGRLTISDIVSEGAFPDETKKAGCKSVQVLSSKESYLDGEGSQALMKLLSIAVKAYKGA